jgi:hypothetical protein
VLFAARFREPIARGDVTQTFRRWKRCQVRAGGRYHKLKNLGLALSLGVGYRLSPRGRAYLDGAAGEPNAS